MTATFESFKHRSPLATVFPPAGANGPRLPRPFTWSLRLIACAALGVTGYLAITALLAGEVAGCSGGAVWDCELALHSRWAKVLNMPVSVPAFALYALVLTSLAFCRSTATNSHLRAAWSVVTVSAFAAGLAAIWFISLQVFALGHLCLYCLAAHSCGLVLCALVLWKRPLGGRATARLAAISVLGVGLLIGTQVFSAPPPTYTVEHYASDMPTSSAITEDPLTAATKPGTTKTDGAKSAPGDKPATKAHTPDVVEPPSGIPDDAGDQ
jgi:uncharacterized membrane protein